MIHRGLKQLITGIGKLPENEMQTSWSWETKI